MPVKNVYVFSASFVTGITEIQKSCFKSSDFRKSGGKEDKREEF